MIIELGNHAALQPGIDDAPKITSVHVPEYDDGSTHPDAVYEGAHPHDSEETGTLKQPGPATGGYTHEPGLSVAEFKDHLVEAIIAKRSITHLPGHEILVGLLHPDGAWARHGAEKPAWVKVHEHHDGLTPTGRAADIERFLSEFWGIPVAEEHFKTDDSEELLVAKELGYWTRTPPGEIPPGLSLPPATALYTNDGRSMSNINDGGGQVGAVGQASASSATTLTTASTYTTNQWAGYRVYATVSAAVMVWGNVISNTNASNASVLTVDRWYAAATPGGAAGTTPSATATFLIADGGMVATWFVGLATGANAATAADHTLATNGNAEITTSGGGLIRKIAPYAQTSGVATRSITLTPVFTANGTDSLPATVTNIGVFASMVSTFGGAGGPMKFETPLNASATAAASGDQITVTDTVAGS